MNEPPVTIALRIPGLWKHPKELIEALPAGCRFTPESLILPDGTEVGFGAMDADDQFPTIFRNSLRSEPEPEELAAVDGYRVNVLLSDPGGSMESARTIMRAAAAIIEAGGAGVFIDNSGLAHGGRAWVEMAEDGGPDALSFAFTAIIRGKKEVYTMGMHALGLRDFVMKREDADADDEYPVQIIRYIAASDKPVENGHVIADQNGPRFQAFIEESPREYAHSPMHNPFGRLRLVSAKDVAESN